MPAFKLSLDTSAESVNIQADSREKAQNPPITFMNEDTQEIIALLKENNHYLKNLWELKRKEHRSAVISHIIHFIVTALPWIVILLLGYFVWQSIMHYLDALNQNINILKGNFDTVYEFLKKLIPDFGKIGPQLQQIWQKVQFWK